MEETQNQTQEQAQEQTQEQTQEQPGMYQSELHRAPGDDGDSAPEFLSGIRRSVWED